MKTKIKLNHKLTTTTKLCTVFFKQCTHFSWKKVFSRTNFQERKCSRKKMKVEHKHGRTQWRKHKEDIRKVGTNQPNQQCKSPRLTLRSLWMKLLEWIYSTPLTIWSATGRLSAPLWECGSSSLFFSSIHFRRVAELHNSSSIKRYFSHVTLAGQKKAKCDFTVNL